MNEPGVFTNEMQLTFEADEDVPQVKIGIRSNELCILKDIFYLSRELPQI